MDEMNSIDVSDWPEVQIYDGGQQVRGIKKCMIEKPVTATWLRMNNPLIVVYAGKGLSKLDKILVSNFCHKENSLFNLQLLIGIMFV